MLGGLVSAFMFFGCMDDSDDAYVSYGVIKNVSSSDNYQILTDKGNTLVVTKSHSSEAIENDKRVLVNFEIKSDKEKSKKVYEVEVNGFYQLLSKPLVPESFIQAAEETRRDSIGRDAFINVYAWFGGEYLNINFETYFSEYSGRKHLINLVWDDTRTDSDTLYLTLCHNAYGEKPAYNDMHLFKGAGRCSFRLTDLVHADVASKPVRLQWQEYRYGYDVVTRYDVGDFKPGDTSSATSERYTAPHFEEAARCTNLTN